MTSRRAQTGQPALIEGTVYQLHLDPPLGHARHYTGWTRDLGRMSKEMTEPEASE